MHEDNREVYGGKIGTSQIHSIFYILFCGLMDGLILVAHNINTILYMGAKNEVYKVQKNINNNVNPLRNTYVPATGDVLWW